MKIKSFVNENKYIPITLALVFLFFIIASSVTKYHILDGRTGATTIKQGAPTFYPNVYVEKLTHRYTYCVKMYSGKWKYLAPSIEFYAMVSQIPAEYHTTQQMILKNPKFSQVLWKKEARDYAAALENVYTTNNRRDSWLRWKGIKNVLTYELEREYKKTL